MKKTLVFTATYNEADNIIQLIDSIFKELPDCEILVVDDSSPDGTGKILNFLSEENPKIHVIHRPRKLGLGTAHKLAVKYALEFEFDALVTMDADFSHNPKHIPKILELLEDHDFVIASRFAEGGKCDYGRIRMLLSRSANLAARMLLGIPLHETTTSFRGFSKSLLSTFEVDVIHADGYSYFFECVFYICNKTRNIVEFPFHFEDRRAGTTKISKKEIFNGISTLVRLTLDRLFKRNSHNPLRKDPRAKLENLLPCNVCQSPFHVEQYSAVSMLGKSAQYTCTSTHHSSHGRIVQCLNCGLIYTNPQLSPEKLLSIYTDVEDKTYLDNIEARVRTFEYNFERIKRFLPKQGKLLDIGSYCGVFLKIARDVGYDVLGVEPSSWASKYANQELKVPTLNGRVKDLVDENKTFDIACAWDVVEHFSDPMGELRLINQILNLGGVFAFSTLNYENWFPKLMGERWPWMMDMHLYYFTDEIIGDMLAKNGFRLKHVEAYRHIITVDYFFLKLHSLGVPGARFLRKLINRTSLAKKCIPFYFGDIQLYVCEKVTDISKNVNPQTESRWNESLSLPLQF